MKTRNHKLMELIKRFKTASLVLWMIFQFNAASAREIYAVFNMDITGTESFKSNQLGNVLRMHFEKLDSFEVVDRYEMSNLIESMGATRVSSCFAKSCLAEVGKKLNADKVVSGSIDHVGSYYMVTLRRLDVKAGEIDKLVLREYLANTEHISTILLLAMNELLGLPNPEALYISLTKKDAFANSVNNPYYPRLRTDGPRLGVSMVTGEAAKILAREENQGGFNAYPMTFHFGYQFEKQYLNSGNFQALFEFIPLISGMEQGRLAFSFSMLNGIRSNRGGWEFAFGPSVGFTQFAQVAEDQEGNLLTQKLWEEKYPGQEPVNGYRKQLDSRGDIALDPSFVLAAGKTFKSGSMNIPVNVFIIPKKDDLRFGISVGYNAKK
ncbi:MAG TPA: hypothetical protein DIW47_15800 [Bacteroidetes bacterium]|nr:hypothetical protein [Bacteroidota bacterium]